MKHLKAANGVRPAVPSAAAQPTSEYCLADYAHCPVSDLCWIADLDGGCLTSDSCIIDTM